MPTDMDKWIPTEFVTDLDLQSERIIFESLLTPFGGSLIFTGAVAVVNIGLDLKPNHNKENTL